jgi:hypothetical protein
MDIHDYLFTGKYVSTLFIFNQPPPGHHVDINAYKIDPGWTDTDDGLNPSQTPEMDAPINRPVLAPNQFLIPEARSGMDSPRRAVDAGSEFVFGSEVRYQESDRSTLPPNYHHVFMAS